MLRKIKKTLKLIMLGIPPVMVLVVGLCQLESVQTKAFQYFVQSRFDKEPLAFAFGKIHGFFPFHFHMDSFTVKTKNATPQTLLQLGDIEVALKLKQFFKGRLRFESLKLKTLKVQNLKQWGKLAPRTKTQGNIPFYGVLHYFISHEIFPVLTIVRATVENLGMKTYDFSLQTHVSNMNSKTVLSAAGKNIAQLDFKTDINHGYYTLHVDDANGVLSPTPVVIDADIVHHTDTQKVDLAVKKLKTAQLDIHFQTSFVFLTDTLQCYGQIDTPLPFSYAAVISFENNTLRFDSLVVHDKAKGVVIEAKSKTPLMLNDNTIEGSFNVLYIKALTPLFNLFSLTKHPPLTFNVRFDTLLLQGNLDIEGGELLKANILYDTQHQKLTAKGSINAESIKDFTLHQVDFLFEGDSHFNGSFTLKTPFAKTTYFSVQNIAVTGSVEKGTMLHYKLHAGKDALHEPVIVTRGTFDLTHSTLHVTELLMKYRTLQYRLMPAVQLNFEKDMMTVSPFTLYAKMQNNQAGELIWDPKQQTLTLHNFTLAAIDFFNLMPDINANIKGQINFSKQLHPVKGALTFENFTLTSKSIQKKDVLQTLQWNMQFSNQLNFVELNMNSLLNQKNQFNAKGRVLKQNGRFSLSCPLNLKLQGALNLGMILSLFSVPDHIDGDLDINLNLQGTLLNPLCYGEIMATNGVYESFINGTYIGHMTGKIYAKGDHFQIDEILGTDQQDQSKRDEKKESGTLRISGSAKLSFISIFEANLFLTLENLSVVRRDDIFIKGSGYITLKGKGLQSHLGGRVTLTPGVILLNELTDDDITAIVLEKDGKLKPTRKQLKHALKIKKRMSDPLFPINLELVLGKDFLIKGNGIYSHWGGSMFVRGDFSEGPPYLEGMITLIDGKMSVFGKKMTILSSTIRFDAVDENNPDLFLEALKKQDGYTLYMQVKGRANDNDFVQKTRFTFYSDPALTEDSVMSMIFFGKKANEITAGQSVQLAAIGASLSGKKNTNLNVFDSIRSALGFDILELKENNLKALNSSNGITTDQTLSIGKEIGDFKIYYDQSVGGAGSKTTLSHPIDHNLSVDLDIGDKTAGSGAGISWSLQY